MKKARVFVAIVCLTASINLTSADTIQGINFDFVTIGNADDPTVPWYLQYPGYVDYNYRIGKYEVTNSQWNTFTTIAGTPTGNPSNAYDEGAYFTGDQKPTNMLSWYEAAQFCNYLTSGDKSLGAYQLGTDGSIVVDRDAAVSAFGITYVIPTPNEWFKAAYRKPDGSGYSYYANGTDTAPSESDSCYSQSSPYNGPWDVGTGTEEQNGTFDMMGNVFEWSESLAPPSARYIMGGCFYTGLIQWGDIGIIAGEVNEADFIGLRIVEIPEPATLLLFSLGGLLLRKKRR